MADVIDPSALRRLAAERLERTGRPPGDGVELELGIHEEELRMQNEALREALAELQRSRDRYRDLFDLSPVPCLTLSSRGAILSASAAAARLLGVPAVLLRNVPLASFFLPEDAGRFELYRRSILSGGSTDGLDLILVSRDEKHYEVTLESACSDLDSGEWRAAILDRNSTAPVSPALLEPSGVHIPLETLELRWSETGGWAFTAVANMPLTAKVSALRIFGVARRVAIEKIHTASRTTSLAGRLLEPESSIARRR